MITFRFRCRADGQQWEAIRMVTEDAIFPDRRMVMPDGPLPIPNRHNARVMIDRIRRNLELDVASEFYKHRGTIFGATYEPRLVQVGEYGNFGDWFVDEGDTLLYTLIPETSGEGFIEGLANAERNLRREP